MSLLSSIISTSRTQLFCLLYVMCMPQNIQAANWQSPTLQEQLRMVTDFVDTHPSLHSAFEEGMLQKGPVADLALNTVAIAYLRYITGMTSVEPLDQDTKRLGHPLKVYPNSAVAWARNICYLNNGFKGPEQIDEVVLDRLGRLVSIQPSLIRHISNNELITKTQAKLLACDVADQVFGIVSPRKQRRENR